MSFPWEALLPILTGGANIGAALGQYKLGSEATDIELQNLQLAKNTLDYQKALQGIMFQREDTSVQRRVKDLKAAGLSPVLAAGQGARAGEAIKVVAPQMKPSGKLMQMQALGNIADIGITLMDALSREAQINKTRAETTLIEQTTPQHVRLNELEIQKRVDENKILHDTIEDVIQLAKSNNLIRKHELTLTTRDALYAQDLENYLTRLSNKYGIRITPEIITTMREEIQYRLAEKNMSLYDALGGSDVSQGLLGLLQKVIPSIISRFLYY